MASVMAKLKKTSTIKETDVLTNSVFFKEEDMIPTDSPAMNIALSGSIDGGLSPGILQLAGPSKHFKTSFGLMLASTYMKEKKDAVLLFYDNEFGSPQAYFEMFGIDTDRVLHTPIKNIEELKFDIVQQLEGLEAEDEVIIMIDSIGNLASLKELEDAKDMKSVEDMTRAKKLKSVFRMVTPYLNMKKIPLLAINHTYKTLEMFSKDVPSGGPSAYYSAADIWINGRSQNKKGTDVVGYNFNIVIDKSRYVKEKSKIPITVSWEGGVHNYSGLLKIALDGGFVYKPVNGKYCVLDKDTGEEIGTTVKEDKTLEREFWEPLLDNTDFKEYIKEKFKQNYKRPQDE
jgi:RecA/RadA recombinase